MSEVAAANDGSAVALSADESYYRSGIVFATVEELPSTLPWFVQRPHERTAVAARGAALFRLRDAVHVIGPAVQALYQQRGCV